LGLREPCASEVHCDPGQIAGIVIATLGSGKKVKSKKQAVAIGLSEARKKGKKVAKKKS
jgi:hypothetical protein